jgi:non-canonical purine NTP pyrophosphatase, rdgB/HAM1 family
MKLLLATRNRNKTREFADLLGCEFQVADINAEADLPEIEETGQTFEENAIIKAVAVSRLRPKKTVIADDSGLEIEALDGRPGIFSARYAGLNATDGENIDKVLQELEALRSANRTARFRCVIAVARGGELLNIVSGEVVGTIGRLPRGENGFGYDPVFVPEGFGQTFAELAPKIKNGISHRAQAAKRLRQFLIGN